MADIELNGVGLDADGLRKPQQHSHASSSQRKALSSFAMALLTFSCVAGGPFGIEIAVKSAGAFSTIMGLFFAGILWGMPQALITAELAAALPSNGGPVHWVARALGPRWGFVNGCLLVLQQATDICMYPTLIASYVGVIVPSMGPWGLYGVKVLSVAFAVVLNIVGVDALSASAALLTTLIMLPFLLLPCVAAGLGATFTWAAVGPAATPADWTASLATFVSTILWSMQGWSEVGCVAGEIQHAEIVFPRGMVLAAALVTLAYVVPVTFGVALQPNTDLWVDGFLVTVARDVAPWLAALVVLSAILSNLSSLLSGLAAYSRTLQAVARQGFIPVPLLARNQTRFETPVAAICVLALSTLALTYGLHFSALVIADSCFYTVSQASVIFAFIRLKYSDADLPRPYLFPGGMVGAWTAVAVSAVLVVVALLASLVGGGLAPVVLVLASLVALVLASFAWSHAPCCSRAAQALHDEWEHYDDSNSVSAATDDEEEAGNGEKPAGRRSAPLPICSDQLYAALSDGTVPEWQRPYMEHFLRDPPSLVDALMGGDSNLLGRVVRSLSAERTPCVPAAAARAMSRVPSSTQLPDDLA